MKDETQYTGTKREKRKIRRIKHNTHMQIERREKEKDKTQYTHTDREKRIIRRIKHNTHVHREGREKEEGENTIHAYKKRQE